MNIWIFLQIEGPFLCADPPVLTDEAGLDSTEGRKARLQNPKHIPLRTLRSSVDKKITQPDRR
jgi:hypothetical protein